jgi:putative ABC transport system permease protein
MFKNFFTVALRNFQRNQIFSLINIAGLAIGISASLVIYLIVQHEFNFDKFHKDGDRIYRVVTNMHFPDQDFKNSGSPGPLPAAMRNEIPGIERSAAFWNSSPMKVSITDNNEKENIFRKQSNIIYADEEYFRFFRYQWLAGSPDNLLNGVGEVVLTESRAKVYFPFLDITHAIGQTIVYNDSVKATVKGIVKDINEITDFTFKEFISLATFSDQLKNNNGWSEWGSVSSASQFFIKLRKDIDPKKINLALAELRKKHTKKSDYLATDHFLQPLRDIHFNADFDAFDRRQTHKPTLYGLLAVAVFLLLLGCINFINLTTAQAAQRAKEIGIRKTMGSSRSHLIIQFLCETILLTLLAAIVSVVLAPSLLKLFADYIPDGLQFDLFRQPHLIVFILLLVLMVGLLSGFYPALVLSGYKPVLVLKNIAYANSALTRRVWIRKTLTVSQFVIAQFFIIATMVVAKQIRFTLNKDMGFKKDAIINFSVPYNYQNQDTRQFVLQEKLKAIPGIQQLSLAGPPPASEGYNITTMEFDNGKKLIKTSVEDKRADTGYFNLYKLKLLAGRNLQQSDTLREYVINETYAKFLGYYNPADIIGRVIDRGSNKIPVVGVMADINTKSLHKAIQPLVFSCQAKNHNTFHVSLPAKGGNTDAWKTTIAAIGKAWKEIYPEEEFRYTFFDESIAKFYTKEQQTASLLNWCTGLAIFISCLGLLGLVIYTTAQRAKEIGVRKVLGASVSQIVSLLSKDFMQLVILAFVIAAPLAWWAMNKWLDDFAYRTSISWWVFGLSGVIMIVISLFTLGIQTIRSAIANPVKSLRTE